MILLDLDGVCADFLGHVLNLTGHTEQEMLDCIKNNPETHPYDLLGELVNKRRSEFWDWMEGLGDFFETIPPLPWFKKLWDGLEEVDKVYFLTSGPYPGSFIGKATWVEKHLGKYDSNNKRMSRRCIICSSEAKHALAKPGNVLIDDTEKNIEEWTSKGAPAYFFPSLQFWSRHPTDDEINQAIEFAREHNDVHPGIRTNYI